MRTASAWFVGILVFLFVGTALYMLGDAAGVPPLIHHDPPILYDDYLVFSTASFFGCAAGLFSVIVGTWAGQATFAKSWWAGFTPAGRLTFLAWLMAAVILLAASALVDLAFQRGYDVLLSYVRFTYEIGIVVGVGWACRKWWKNRVAELKGRE